MSLFYKVSEEDNLELRNKIFIQKGIPLLQKQNFFPSPFTGAWYGKNNLGDYTYEFCRICKNKHLEIVVTHISKGDEWVKIFLNIFEVSPKLKSLKELEKVDGLQFGLMPNSRTEMRLREDDFKGMPLFNFVHHCIGSYATEAGFKKRLKQLGDLIERDMNNIDSFVQRWHELHTPLVTDWEGHVIGKDESNSEN